MGVACMACLAWEGARVAASLFSAPFPLRIGVEWIVSSSEGSEHRSHVGLGSGAQQLPGQWLKTV